MPCITETIDEGPRYERLLCYVLTEYKAGVAFSRMLNGHPEVRVWWRLHEAQDAERLEREAKDAKVSAAKKRALAKLTDEERSLLGFHGEAR